MAPTTGRTGGPVRGALPSRAVAPGPHFSDLVLSTSLSWWSRPEKNEEAGSLRAAEEGMWPLVRAIVPRGGRGGRAALALGPGFERVE